MFDFKYTVKTDRVPISPLGLGSVSSSNSSGIKFGFGDLKKKVLFIK